MMTERGFVTVFALCLILVFALIVKGIQESETNHNYEAADFQAQFDLQSAADGGIYEAAEKVRSGQKELLPNNFEAARNDYQVLLVSRTVKISNRQIRVDVWGERLQIQHYERLYPSYKKSARGGVEYGYALISVAELDSPRFGKVYRRAFAYVIDGKGCVTGLEGEIVPDEQPVAAKDKDVVHFMTMP